MSMHPKLARFKGHKHLKVFNKYLGGIESEIKQAGASDYDAEVFDIRERKSLLGRIFTMSYGEQDEALYITTEVYQCPVEILVPVGIGNMAMPYSISVVLPGSIPTMITYEKSMAGFRWHSEPKNKALVNQLKNAVPKAITKQNQYNKGVGYILKQCYAFQRTDTGNTEWLIYSGYEGGVLSGGYRPRVGRYLNAIPKVRNALAG